MLKSNFRHMIASAFGALFFTFASMVMVSAAVPTQADAPVQAGD